MKITSTLIIFILCAALVGAVYWGFTERKARDAAEAKTKQEVAALTNPTAPLVKTSVDEKGQKHSTFETSNNSVSKNTVAVSKSVLDTIAKLSGVDKKDIADWKEIAMSLKAENLQAKEMIDSLKQKYFYYYDEYVKLAYRPANPLDTLDKGKFDFSYNAKLSTVDHNKGLKFLGANLGTQRTFTDVYSNDTRTTINGLRTLRIEPKQNDFSANVFTFANYYTESDAVQFGAGIKIELGRLELNGGYHYSTNPFEIKRPKPFFGARFNAFR